MRHLRHLISAAAVAVCLAATTVHAAPITAPSVTYQLGIYDLTVTPTGPTTLNLDPGDAFHIEGTWLQQYDPSNNGCYNCAHQTYIAGLPPLSLQFNLVNDLSTIPRTSQGTYSGNFTAPLAAGIYYVGANFTLAFNFANGVGGAINGANQASYILNVGQDDVSTVPEPASLMLLGTGICGLVASRRRTRK